jgi:hypothetical protein
VRVLKYGNTNELQGMEYKYVAKVDTVAFSEAPPQIMHALGRLSWATEHVVNMVGDKYLPPNELLMLGYFEDMKIGVSDLVADTLR